MLMVSSNPHSALCAFTGTVALVETSAPLMLTARTDPAVYLLTLVCFEKQLLVLLRKGIRLLYCNQGFNLSGGYNKVL
jgi:hypothetical protein